MIINKDIINLKGVGEKTQGLLNKAGVFTLHDLFYYYPRTYRKYSSPVNSLEEISETEPTAFLVRITKAPTVKGRTKTPVTIIREHTSFGFPIEIIFFRMPYLRSSLIIGKKYVFFGMPKNLTDNGQITINGTNAIAGNAIRLEQPEIFPKEKYVGETGSLQPVYPLVKGLKNNTVKKLVEESLVEPDVIEDHLPNELIQKNKLLSLDEAIKSIHFPSSEDAYKEARRRLSYDEFLSFFLNSDMDLDEISVSKNEFVLSDFSYYEKMIKELPFDLTDGQKNALKDIRSDLKEEYQSERLIQGDVGSGKTMVAFLSMLIFVENHYQALMMAPTEVLAEQHYENFCKFIEDYSLPCEVVLLTGAVKGKKRKEVYEKIQNIDNLIIVGTNALLTETVPYREVGIVITDEQHRFGVKQRAALLEKNGKVPYSLLLSATPIPRTLSLILFKHMKVSLIKDLPANRLPIKNVVIGKDKRHTALNFILKEIRTGHQAYIICPLVESSEKTEEENVTEYFKKVADYYRNLGLNVIDGNKLKVQDKINYATSIDSSEMDSIDENRNLIKNDLLNTSFAENKYVSQNKSAANTENESGFKNVISLGILHGRMKDSEKNQVMELYAAHKIDILISTTVIEVGIDVKNATVIMIENAERFGLSQLHQLRGRVGRGDAQSYCIFMNLSKENKESERLKVINSSNDGFYIAEQDLKLRGPGDMLGIRQSGDMGFVLADLVADSDIMKEASNDAEHILAEDQTLSSEKYKNLKNEYIINNTKFYRNL